MGVVETIALTLGVAWASGINLYAAIAMLGLLGSHDMMQLPGGLEILEHPAVITAACVMYVIEFFADKVPALDSFWDAIHSFIRIPAGAVLAAAAVSEVAPEAELVAALLGGALAGTTHVTKMGSRAVINASPEPFSNWGASVAEDVLVVGGLYAAAFHPWVFLALLAAFVAFAVWVVPRVWRFFKRAIAFVRHKLLGGPAPSAQPPLARPAEVTVEVIEPRRLPG